MLDGRSAKAETTSATLAVPGARLYYEVCGSGPVLLMIQSGAGGADGSVNIAPYLADRFTVVSYDRRGLSRSPLERPAGGSEGIEQHSEDCHRLLTALTTEPAFVFGSSIGALIGLDLVARHPEQVTTLVAHEPPAPELLPDEEGDAAERAQEAVEHAYRREGLPSAMRAFAVIVGLDVSDREADVEIPRPDERRTADTVYFLTHDAPAVRRYRLDLEALRTARTRVVAAAGRSSADSWPHHCAKVLAARLDTLFVESPGGHNGHVMRPKAFAAWLSGVLES